MHIFKLLIFPFQLKWDQNLEGHRIHNASLVDQLRFQVKYSLNTWYGNSLMDEVVEELFCIYAVNGFLTMFGDVNRTYWQNQTKSNSTVTGKNGHAIVAKNRFEDIMTWCIKINRELLCSMSFIILNSKLNTMDLLELWVRALYYLGFPLNSPAMAVVSAPSCSPPAWTVHVSVLCLSFSLSSRKAHLKLYSSQLSRWLANV